MKLLLKILLLLLLPGFGEAQSRKQMDSAYYMLRHTTNDTIKMDAYSILGGFYDDINADSGLYYCNRGIAIAEKLDLQLNKAEIMALMSIHLIKTGNYPEALRVISQGIKIAEDASNEKKRDRLKTGKHRKITGVELSVYYMLSLSICICLLVTMKSKLQLPIKLFHFWNWREIL